MKVEPGQRRARLILAATMLGNVLGSLKIGGVASARLVRVCDELDALLQDPASVILEEIPPVDRKGKAL